MKKLDPTSAQSKTNSLTTGKLKSKYMSIFPLFKKQYTYISSGITLHGDLIADENVVLDGKMSGNIRSTKHVSLGSTAHFDGSIESESAVISGYVKGRIMTKQTLIVQVPATIIGDLVSASVKVESGVVLHGKIISTPHREQFTQEDIQDKTFGTLVEPVETR